MALIHVNGIGVGEYNANQTIEAENFYAASGIQKMNSSDGGFYVTGIDNDDYLIYNNIHELHSKTSVTISLSCTKKSSIEIRRVHPDGPILRTSKLEKHPGGHTLTLKLPHLNQTESICFVFKGNGQNLATFDSFTFE